MAYERVATGLKQLHSQTGFEFNQWQLVSTPGSLNSPPVPQSGHLGRSWSDSNKLNAPADRFNNNITDVNKHYKTNNDSSFGDADLILHSPFGRPVTPGRQFPYPSSPPPTNNWQQRSNNENQPLPNGHNSSNYCLTYRNDLNDFRPNYYKQYLNDPSNLQYGSGVAEILPPFNGGGRYSMDVDRFAKSQVDDIPPSAQFIVQNYQHQGSYAPSYIYNNNSIINSNAETAKGLRFPSTQSAVNRMVDFPSVLFPNRSVHPSPSPFFPDSYSPTARPCLDGATCLKDRRQPRRLSPVRPHMLGKAEVSRVSCSPPEQTMTVVSQMIEDDLRPRMTKLHDTEAGVVSCRETGSNESTKSSSTKTGGDSLSHHPVSKTLPRTAYANAGSSFECATNTSVDTSDLEILRPDRSKTTDKMKDKPKDKTRQKSRDKARDRSRENKEGNKNFGEKFKNDINNNSSVEEKKKLCLFEGFVSGGINSSSSYSTEMSHLRSNYEDSELISDVIFDTSQAIDKVHSEDGPDCRTEQKRLSNSSCEVDVVFLDSSTSASLNKTEMFKQYIAPCSLQWEVRQDNQFNNQDKNKIKGKTEDKEVLSRKLESDVSSSCSNNSITTSNGSPNQQLIKPCPVEPKNEFTIEINSKDKLDKASECEKMNEDLSNSIRKSKSDGPVRSSINENDDNNKNKFDNKISRKGWATSRESLDENFEFNDKDFITDSLLSSLLSSRSPLYTTRNTNLKSGDKKIDDNRMRCVDKGQHTDRPISSKLSADTLQNPSKDFQSDILSSTNGTSSGAPRDKDCVSVFDKTSLPEIRSIIREMKTRSVSSPSRNEAPNSSVPPYDAILYPNSLTSSSSFRRAEDSVRRDLRARGVSSRTVISFKDVKFLVTDSRKAKQFMNSRTAVGFSPEQFFKHGVAPVKINSGTFCSVFKAEYLGKIVAVKCPNESLLKADAHMMRYRSVLEWKILSRTNHPNVLKFHGGVIFGDQIWLVTDFAEGGDLYTLLYHRPAEVLQPKIRMTMMMELAESVSYLHLMEPMVVHKDLKCNNLLVDRDMHLSVCDFGDAEEMQSEFIQCCTAATWQYTPPELLVTDDPARPRGATEKVDVWAIGCVFLEILKCPTPFVHILDEIPEDKQRDTLRSLLLDKTLESECRIPLALPKLWRVIVSKCLDFNPVSRPSANQLLILMRSNSDALLRELTTWQFCWGNNKQSHHADSLSAISFRRQVTYLQDKDKDRDRDKDRIGDKDKKTKDVVKDVPDLNTHADDQDNPKDNNMNKKINNSILTVHSLREYRQDELLTCRNTEREGFLLKYENNNYFNKSKNYNKNVDEEKPLIVGSQTAREPIKDRKLSDDNSFRRSILANSGSTDKDKDKDKDKRTYGQLNESANDKLLNWRLERHRSRPNELNSIESLTGPRRLPMIGSTEPSSGSSKHPGRGIEQRNQTGGHTTREVLTSHQTLISPRGVPPKDDKNNLMPLFNAYRASIKFRDTAKASGDDKTKDNRFPDSPSFPESPMRLRNRASGFVDMNRVSTKDGSRLSDVNNNNNNNSNKYSKNANNYINHHNNYPNGFIYNGDRKLSNNNTNIASLARVSSAEDKGTSLYRYEYNNRAKDPIANNNNVNDYVISSPRQKISGSCTSRSVRMLSPADDVFSENSIPVNRLDGFLSARQPDRSLMKPMYDRRERLVAVVGGIPSVGDSYKLKEPVAPKVPFLSNNSITWNQPNGQNKKYNNLNKLYSKINDVIGHHMTVPPVGELVRGASSMGERMNADVRQISMQASSRGDRQISYSLQEGNNVRNNNYPVRNNYPSRNNSALERTANKWTTLSPLHNPDNDAGFVSSRNNNSNINLNNNSARMYSSNNYNNNAVVTDKRNRFTVLSGGINNSSNYYMSKKINYS